MPGLISFSPGAWLPTFNIVVQNEQLTNGNALIGWSQAGLVPRPHLTHIASSIMCVALKVICAGVGLGIIATRQLSHEYVEKF